MTTRPDKRDRRSGNTYKISLIDIIDSHTEYDGKNFENFGINSSLCGRSSRDRPLMSLIEDYNKQHNNSYTHFHYDDQFYYEKIGYTRKFIWHKRRAYKFYPKKHSKRKKRHDIKRECQRELKREPNFYYTTPKKYYNII